MGCLSFSAIKHWSFGVMFHHKKGIHSTFLVNQNDIKNAGFWIWLLSLWCKVTCKKQEREYYDEKNCFVVTLSSHPVLSMCMLGLAYYYCCRLKLNFTNHFMQAHSTMQPKATRHLHCPRKWWHVLLIIVGMPSLPWSLAKQLIEIFWSHQKIK